MTSTLLLLLSLAVAAPPPAPPAAPPPPSAPASPQESAAEREAKLLAVVQKRAPERYTELVALRAKDPVTYVFALQAAARDARADGGEGGDPDASVSIPDDPRIAEIQARVDLLASDFATQPATVQDARRKEVLALSAELFDLRQAQRRARVAQIEERLTRLEAQIADREARREDLIARWAEKSLTTPPKPR